MTNRIFVFDCSCGFRSLKLDEFMNHTHRDKYPAFEKLYRKWGYLNARAFIWSLSIDFLTIGLFLSALLWVRNQGGLCVSGLHTEQIKACQKVLGIDFSNWTYNNTIPDLNYSNLFNISR